MLEDTLDAVHHRLSTDPLYQCYDCFQKFTQLENLAEHTVATSYHSEKMCLKCRTSVTIFYHHGIVVTLHNCVKSKVKHLHGDLFTLSQYLATKLGLSKNDSTNLDVIACDIQSCPESFAPTANGVYRYLKHANKYLHSTVPNCRKCTLPEFQMVVNNVKTISHFCTKIGKPIYVDKS